MQQERDLVNSLLSRYWAGRTLPIDPFEIASMVGLRIAPIFDASGWYKAQERTIYFNPTEPLVRQRFTVAHELGHHFLNHGDRPRDSAPQFSTTADPIEAQANRFAAELLMPAGSVRLLIVDHKVADISTLAQYFNVSEIAMKYRLMNLGYLR
ncbi:ImmA/IrrE family metallo-endopeptidase [Stenotrophomonas sepilia]|uniref:ImmA/IrrE family metallo-endopeptidase n=1 Tax=Stenotrophomonas sepilia TaxID=2860290 RepID=UPI002E75E509|nr:ImmA/IrrE family metallo-endopeptidase [Stenotrophomonas sepilia]